jgi:WD40 repeat protein/serine/threonine protein kinase
MPNPAPENHDGGQSNTERLPSAAFQPGTVDMETGSRTSSLSGPTCEIPGEARQTDIPSEKPESKTEELKTDELVARRDDLARTSGTEDLTRTEALEPVVRDEESRTAPLGEATQDHHATVSFSDAKIKEWSKKAPLPRVRGYEILEVLGHGGMGVVYKARHLALNRIVALKMLLGGSHASQRQVRRFLAEAEAVARLRHPNIVQIFDIGEQDGLQFFSMEYIEGGSLNRIAKAGPQAARASADLVKSLARAMQHAHEKGIAHRDLKPANILLACAAHDDSHTDVPDLAGCVPKITDFGLVKFLDEAEGHTRTGAVVGTPSYMSPEQASGRSKDAGTAADIYALGAILYALATGRPPFQADTTMNTMRQVLMEEPVAPTRLQSQLPRDLETIILKCLEKHPQKRYTAAADLADDLQRFLDGKPILARPASTVERMWKWARRRPAVAALSTAIVLLTVFGFTIVTSLWLEATSASQRERRERLRAERALAESLLQRGIDLGDRGQYGEGLLWLAKALQNCPTEADDLDHSIRLHLASWGRCLPRVRKVFAHPKDVMSIALSSDGATLATGTLDGTVRLWNLVTGENVSDPWRNSGPVQDIAISPDGRKILTGSSDGIVCLWDRGTARLLLKLQAHRERVTTVAFSPDGNLLATGGYDNAAKLWNASSGKQVGATMQHRGWVTAVVFTGDGSHLMTASRDRTIRTWDVRTQKPVGSIWTFPHEVWGLSPSPDGQWAAVALNDDQGAGWIQLRRMKDGSPRGDPVSAGSLFRNVRFSPDGERIVTGDSDGTARLWDLKLRPLGASLRHAPGMEVTGVVFGRDGSTVVTGSRDGTARLWDISDSLPWKAKLRPGGTVWHPTFSPDGTRLALVSRGDTLLLWDVSTGRRLGRAMVHDGRIVSVAFSPDGKWLLTADHSGAARLWDVASGKPGRKFQHAAVLTLAMFNPTGNMVLTLDADKAAHLWNLETGEKRGAPMAHADSFGAGAQFHPSGATFLTVAGKNVHLWDVATQAPIGKIAHERPVAAARFSPDGTRLASAMADGKVRLWNTLTLLPVTEFTAHPEQGGVIDLDFSPKGQKLLTRGRKMVRLWDTSSSQPIGLPMAHDDTIWVARFSADGRSIMTASTDQTIRLWEAATGKPLGAPFRHTGGVMFADLSPTNDKLVAVCPDEKGDFLRLWQIMPLRHGNNGEIMHQIEVDSGLELDDTNNIRRLDRGEWQTRFDEQQRRPDGQP